MRVSPGSSVLLVFLLAPFCFSQLPSSRCDSTQGALKTCIYLPQIDTTPERALKPDAHAVEVRALQATDGKSDSGQTTMAAEPSRNDSFHWRRALTESFTFLVIEQAYVVHTDFNWVVSENGIPFNHYWRDYMQSLSEWTHSGWNDGDPNWFGYVGHPIQGALTGFIQIQNDPRSEKLEFSKTKEYWWSRLQYAVESWTAERSHSRKVWHENPAAEQLQRDIPLLSTLLDRCGPNRHCDDAARRHGLADRRGLFGQQNRAPGRGRDTEPSPDRCGSGCAQSHSRRSQRSSRQAALVSCVARR